MTKRHSLEYSFTTLYLWQEQYNMEFCIDNEVLFIRSGKDKKMYLFPMANGDIKKAVECLATENVTFYSLSEEQADLLNAWYPEKYSFIESRDMGDYVYRTEDLAYLKGKKLSAKRNHINRFIAENPDWCYEDITPDNIEEVKLMHQKWCELADEEKGLFEESVAVKTALDNYFELRFSGGRYRKCWA